MRTYEIACEKNYQAMGRNKDGIKVEVRGKGGKRIECVDVLNSTILLSSHIHQMTCKHSHSHKQTNDLSNRQTVSIKKYSNTHKWTKAYTHTHTHTR
jgi:hypothetical protein